MSDVNFRDRKLRKVKRESVTAQKIPLKNKGELEKRRSPDKKRGETRVKK